MEIIFILNAASTLFLCGLIWIIQVLHYPFFHRLDRENFALHQQAHKMQISYIVVPVMLIELGSSIWLALQESAFQIEFIIGAALVLLIWASTFFIQVPLHGKISSGYNKATVDKLVATNWLRTLLWSLKSLIIIYIMYDIVTSTGF